jgi:uncharacterized membrane protein
MIYPDAFLYSLLSRLFWLGIVIGIIILLVRAGRKKGPTGVGAKPDAAAQLDRLDRRLAVVEQRLDQIAGPAAPAAEEPRPAPPAQPTPSAAPPPRRARPPSQVPPPRIGGLDLETLIAGRVMNRVGIVALLFAVGFFLKYAFDNDWLGDRGRVAIGLLLGAGLIGYSQMLLKRRYTYFSEGIAGLGAAVLYLSFYAGWSFYHLFSPTLAFTCMILITAAMVSLAIGRDSQRVAWIALAGGFMTPILVSTGRDEQLILFGYLAVLDAALLALARVRNWRSLELLAFFATQFFFWGWMERFYASSKLGRTSGFATLFFLLFASLPLLRARSGKLASDQVLLVLLNALAFLGALHRLLWPHHRWPLTIAVLALAAVHLAAARAVGRSGEPERERVRLVFAGLGLTFATIAIPIRLDGAWVAIAWSVEGTVLVWTGFRVRMRFLRSAALVLFALAAVRLMSYPLAADRLFLNPRFGAFATTAVCYGLALDFARRRSDALAPGEGTLFAPLSVALNVIALAALSMEAWDGLGRLDLGVGRDSYLARELGLSLLWLFYGSALMTLGVRMKAAALRWQSLLLFGLVVGKVFLFDLSFLDRFYRITSFVVLGVVLLVVSFLYQARLAEGGGGEKS